MGTRSRRECLFLVSLFFLVSKLGHAQRIKFKILWTFSFCTLFVFLELLWFTSLVSFTGFYMEEKPKFFCDCPTDVSLRSPFPTCFLFLSSFFFPLLGIYSCLLGLILVVLWWKFFPKNPYRSDIKELPAWGRPRFSSKFSPFLSALVIESVFQKWNIDDVRGCTRDVIPHGRCVKLRCIFMQVTLIAGIFCTDPTYHLKNLNWYVLLMGTELFWWIFLG